MANVNAIRTPDAFDFIVGSQFDLNILDSQTDTLNIMFGDYADDIFVDDGAGNMMFGDAGDDLILIGSDQDQAYGGDGVDVIITNPDNNDWSNEDEGRDRLSDDAGSVWLFGGSDNDHLNGGEGSDGLFGGSGHDSLDGGGGDDYLFGDEGDDVINAGSGNDVVSGGSGNDVMSGGEGSDWFEFYGPDTGMDTITDYDVSVDTIIFSGDYNLQEGDAGTTIYHESGEIFVAGVSAFELTPTIYNYYIGCCLG